MFLMTAEDSSKTSDLQRLVLDRLSELNLSYRGAADRSRGKVSHSTINNIARGIHNGRLTDDALEGLATALDVTVPDVMRAAGISRRRPAAKFELPERAARLSPRQRKAILAMVDALLDEEDRGPGRGRVV